MSGRLGILFFAVPYLLSTSAPTSGNENALREKQDGKSIGSSEQTWADLVRVSGEPEKARTENLIGCCPETIKEERYSFMTDGEVWYLLRAQCLCVLVYVLIGRIFALDNFETIKRTEGWS